MLLRRENALETQYPDVGKHCDAATLGACYLSGMEVAGMVCTVARPCSNVLLVIIIVED